MLECSLEQKNIALDPIVQEFQQSLAQYAAQEQRTIANSRLKKAIREAKFEGKEIAVYQ